jgi:hypothetical protein
MLTSSRGWLRGGLLVAGASLVFACTSEVTVFSDGVNAGSDSGDDGAMATGSGPSTSSGSSTPSTGSTSPDGSGGTSSTGSGPASGSGGSDSTTGAGAGSSMTTGSGGPNAMALECGNSTCPVGGENSCCWDNYEQHGQPQAQCAVGGIDDDDCMTPHNNAGYETRIECQLPSHCPAGQLCCALREDANTALYDETSCQQDCAYPHIVLCDQNTVCPDLPTQGGSVQGVCKQSQLLPSNYTVCGYP